MVRNLIGYPVILAVTLYIGILNRQSWMVALFFAELILFLAEAAAVCYQKSKLLVKFTMPEPVLSGNEYAVTEIFFHNTGRLPIQRIKIRMEYQCLSGGMRKGMDRKRIRVWGNVESEDTQSYGIQAGPFLGGQFLLAIPDIRIYDYFGIFSVKIKIRKKQSIMVIPDFVVMPLLLSRKRVLLGGESDDSRRGQDATELYDIREYQAGDSLRQIYWKRSAGREMILYRESAAQKGAGAVLFLQLPEKMKGILFYYQIKIAGSLMCSLLEAGCEHFLVWENVGEGSLERRTIQKEQDIYDVLSELMENMAVVSRDRHKKKKTKRKLCQRWKQMLSGLWCDIKNGRKGGKAGKNPNEEMVLWQEQMKEQYQTRFVGEKLPEAFFLLSRKPDSRRSSLVLQQETEVIAEFLKDKKLVGTAEEAKLLEEEMENI